MISDHSVISREETALSSQIEDRVMIMDVDKGSYFEIDESAARIWQMIEEPKSFGEICSSLREQYEVTGEQCRADTAKFIDELEELGLVSITA